MSSSEKANTLVQLVVRHCKGETWISMPQEVSDVLSSDIQIRISLEHDKLIHKQEDPCKKLMFRR
jgi:hypothetical protein